MDVSDDLTPKGPRVPLAGVAMMRFLPAAAPTLVYDTSGVAG
jgi:hypothetical protein